MRRTNALIQVVVALLDDPTGRHWGYELSRQARVRSGVLYPILHRMLDDGLLTDGWEDPNELNGKRPPRRYYELTGEGIATLRAVLDEARTDERFGYLLGGLA
jgi:PadR family transcriptional regulator PadR